MKNRFNVTEYLARTVGNLRSSLAEDSSWIPEDAQDEDFAVRIIGRCVEGPMVGHKAVTFQIVSHELIRDAGAFRRISEDKAILGWESLPCQ